MQHEEEHQYDTDLDDDRGSVENFSSRLTFDQILANHRFNRLDCQSVKPTENFPSIVSVNSTKKDRHEIYDRLCFLLDVVPDREIRDLLRTDQIVLIDRSLSFNDLHAFLSAIDSKVKILILHSVGLKCRSTEILCQTLKNCRFLQILDLSENKIDRQRFSTLVKVVKNLSSLTYLSLTGCGVQDAFHSSIGELCRHEQLKELNLSRNEIEEQACIAIGNALKERTNLAYLNLSWNFIRLKASVALFRGLEKNRTLTELNLSWNGLSYDGSVALRRLLIENSTLQRLDISNCHIDWVNAKLISEGLQKNSTLSLLNLSFNPLTTHGVEFLLRGIKVKRSAVSLLDVSGVSIFSTSARLGEKIGREREFQMKYDSEIPVHDVVGSQRMNTTDSMRKLVQHLSDRRWRTLEYFRLLDKKGQWQIEQEKAKEEIAKSGIRLHHIDLENIHQRISQHRTGSLTYEKLHHLINQQRRRDRSLKIEAEKRRRHRNNRHEQILQTATTHFPDIEILTKYEKQRKVVEKMSKPRTRSSKI